MTRSWLPWVEKLERLKSRDIIRRPSEMSSSVLVGASLKFVDPLPTRPKTLEKIGRKVDPCFGAVCIFPDFVGLYQQESEYSLFVLTTDGRDVGTHVARKSRLLSCRWPKDYYHTLDESKRFITSDPRLLLNWLRDSLGV